jgi:flagellar biosynthesis/type III secretory pathway M-ring protein FliF/YscJ
MAAGVSLFAMFKGKNNASQADATPGKLPSKGANLFGMLGIASNSVILLASLFLAKASLNPLMPNKIILTLLVIALVIASLYFLVKKIGNSKFLKIELFIILLLLPLVFVFHNLPAIISEFRLIIDNIMENRWFALAAAIVITLLVALNLVFVVFKKNRDKEAEANKDNRQERGLTHFK